MPSIDYAALVALLARILARHGYSASNAHVLAETMAMAERDAAHSHGAFRLEGYLDDASSGWAMASPRDKTNHASTWRESLRVCLKAGMVLGVIAACQ
jgi:LDH2 family malate/lactate/ureidoglycolate dehydrogenase